MHAGAQVNRRPLPRASPKCLKPPTPPNLNATSHSHSTLASLVGSCRGCEVQMECVLRHLLVACTRPREQGAPHASPLHVAYMQIRPRCADCLAASGYCYMGLDRYGTWVGGAVMQGAGGKLWAGPRGGDPTSNDPPAGQDGIVPAHTVSPTLAGISAVDSYAVAISFVPCAA